MTAGLANQFLCYLGKFRPQISGRRASVQYEGGSCRSNDASTISNRSSKQRFDAPVCACRGDRSISNKPSRLHFIDAKARNTGRPTRPRCPASMSTKGCWSLPATRIATLFSTMPPRARLLASATRNNTLLPLTSDEPPSELTSRISSPSRNAFWPCHPPRRSCFCAR
jgi:hypothetical protein